MVLPGSQWSRWQCRHLSGEPHTEPDKLCFLVVKTELQESRLGPTSGAASSLARIAPSMGPAVLPFLPAFNQPCPEPIQHSRGRWGCGEGEPLTSGSACGTALAMQDAAYGLHAGKWASAGA